MNRPVVLVVESLSCAVVFLGVCSGAFARETAATAINSVAGHQVGASLTSLTGDPRYMRSGDFLRDFEKSYPRLRATDRVVAAIAVVALLNERLDGEFSFRFRRLISKDKGEIRTFMRSRTEEQVARFCRSYGIAPSELRRVVERLTD